MNNNKSDQSEQDRNRSQPLLLAYSLFSELIDCCLSNVKESDAVVGGAPWDQETTERRTFIRSSTDSEECSVCSISSYCPRSKRSWSRRYGWPTYVWPGPCSFNSQINDSHDVWWNTCRERTQTQLFLLCALKAKVLLSWTSRLQNTTAARSWASKHLI